MKQPGNLIVRSNLCGAHSKSTGKPCTRRAMANGRCYVHGGPTPVKHGLYSARKKDNRDIIARVNELKTNPEIMNLRTQLALSITLLERALDALQDSDEDKLEQAKTVSGISTNLAKIAETAHKFEVGYYLKPEQVEAMIQAGAARIQRTCTGCHKLPQLAADLKALSVPE